MKIRPATRKNQVHISNIMESETILKILIPPGKRHGHKKREHNAEEPQDETLPPNISRQETQPFQVGSSGSFPTLHTTGSALARSQSRSHSDHSLKSGSSLHMTSRSHSGSRTLVKSSTSLHHENAPTAKKPAPSKDSVEDIGPPFALLDKSKRQ